jgi:hypothetical protein
MSTTNFKGSTSPEGRLTVTELLPGRHRVRLGLLGYQDREEEFELPSGSTRKYAAILAAARPTPPRNSGSPTVPDENEQAQASSGVQVHSFRVSHEHRVFLQPYPNNFTFLTGTLVVSPGRLQWAEDGYGTPSGSDNFSVPCADVRDAKANPVDRQLAFHIRLSKRKYNFFSPGFVEGYHYKTEEVTAMRRMTEAILSTILGACPSLK